MAYGKKPYSRPTTTRKSSAMAKRRPYAKKTYVSRAPSVRFDGQTMLISQYFEVGFIQPVRTGTGTQADPYQNVPNGGVMAYSIGCDPNNCVVKVGLAQGTLGEVKIGDGVNAEAHNASKTITFDRFDQFKKIFRQYKVDNVSVSITTDRECGLDNPVIALCDKGEARRSRAVVT